VCHPAPVALLPDRIVAESIELHRWTPDLAEPLRAAVDASFDELHPWMPWAAERPTDDDLRSVLTEGSTAFDEDREWTFVVTALDGQGVFGSVGLHRRSGPDTLEIGYWIRTDRVGLGYATMATRALTTAAFSHVPTSDRVEIRMDPANRRSAAVPRRLGYRLDRTVDDPIDSPARTGRSQIWVMGRSAWDPSVT
jgi:RimJ/RimL family protein N-acetyltransferase